jgi:hypothetical protein
VRAGLHDWQYSLKFQAVLVHTLAEILELGLETRRNSGPAGFGVFSASRVALGR